MFPKMNLFLFILFMFILHFSVSRVQAQDTTGTIIDLQEAQFKIPVEAPQVKLFTDRIKPEFDDVHLEKSFKKEILGSGERFILEPINKAVKKERVDISKLLNRKR